MRKLRLFVPTKMTLVLLLLLITPPQLWAAVRISEGVFDRCFYGNRGGVCYFRDNSGNEYDIDMPAMCNVFFTSVRNDFEQQKNIQQFQLAYEPTECIVMIVQLISVPDKWTIVGFNDEGEFKNILIDDSNSELLIELKKRSVLGNKVVELVISKLGRTSPLDKTRAATWYIDEIEISYTPMDGGFYVLDHPIFAQDHAINYEKGNHPLQGCSLKMIERPGSTTVHIDTTSCK